MTLPKQLRLTPTWAANVKELKRLREETRSLRADVAFAEQLNDGLKERIRELTSRLHELGDTIPEPECRTMQGTDRIPYRAAVADD